MGHVIAHIAEDASAVDCSGCVPVVEEDGVSQLPERGCENEE